MKKLLFIVLCSGLLMQSFAQIPVGRFRSHIPMHAFHSVAVASDYVYAATTNGMMLLDIATMDDKNPDLQSWTKVDGLSDIDIAVIYYDKPHKCLIVCYKNGNLDMIKEDVLYNLSDIKNKAISGSKQPSHVRVVGDIAYIAYPFGVVLLDLNDLLVLDTWFTRRNGRQFEVTDFTKTRDEYYISTSNGLFHIRTDHPNPANFMEWVWDEQAGDALFDNILFFGGKLFANKDSHDPSTYPAISDTLFVNENGQWHPTDYVPYDLRSLTAADGYMLVGNWDHIDFLDETHHLVNKYYWQQYSGYPDNQEALLDGNYIWIADNQYGLVRINVQDQSRVVFTESGPFANSVEGISCEKGVVAVVPGSRKGSSYSQGYQYPSASWFVNQQWHYCTDFLNYDSLHTTYDLTNVVINPQNESECYIASWGNGLFRCVNHEIVDHFTSNNSILDSISNGLVFVSGLAYDSKGNLWVTNSQCDNMLKMREPDGTWHEYNITQGVLTASSAGVVAENLLIDSRGYKWVNFPRGDNVNRYHLVAFTESGTYDNPGDDKFVRINMNAASEVNSTNVFCVTEDLDGEIWIGTDKGIKVIYYPDKVFDGNVYPKNILLEQDGYTSVLFEFEEITAIAVDGANRKWVGTSKGGVFLISADGAEELLHFTAEDHPLFSNQISSIGIDPLSGEVFFGSTKGMVSYRGEATRGSDDYSDLLVFPNPVRHGYTGPVAVKGLKSNSLCKITDASGRLVWQGVSNGGELVWNCLDHFGRRPATGVYYVMASDENGKQKIVTKFLFIH